jgi:uncharacterized membrane protein YuzA (DUF378 family)
MGSVDIIRPEYRIEAPVRRRRVLGELFQPRRQHYILHIPLVLFFGAIVTWIIPTEPVMVAACVLGSAVSIYLAYDWLLRRQALRFSTMLALGLLFGYCLGTTNTWLTVPRGSLTLSAYYFRDPAILARAVASVLLACGILISVGELYEHPVFGEEFRLMDDSRIIPFIYSGTALIVVGFLTKRISFGGIGANGSGEVSPISELLFWLFLPLVAIAVSAFLSMPPGRKKMLMGAISAMLLLMLMTQTRRSQIYTGFLILFASRFSGYRMGKSTLRKIVYLVGLAGIIVTGTVSYQLLRTLGQFGGSKSVGVLPRLERAAELVQEGTALSSALSLTGQNVTRRTFVLTFYADCLELTSQKTPAYGGDAFDQAEAVLPRALFPSKTAYESEEVFANKQFGMNFTDQPNSLLTAGAIDFGLMGVVIYPLIMAYLLRKFIELVSTYLPAFPAAFIVLGLLFTSLQTEMTITGYVTLFRDAILISVALLLFVSLPIFRRRSRIL